jgi:RNA polymerase sigma-70 factor (ECF subfamily)
MDSAGALKVPRPADVAAFSPVAADDPEDMALLAALRAGEAAAFESLVRRHGPRMRAAIERLRGCSADVDDTLQEAFVSVFRAIGRFEGRSKLSTWLHRVAVNAALMRLRARRNDPVAEVDELLPGFSPYGAFRDPPGGWVEAPEDSLARDELRAAVRAAIARLPDNHRIPLVLRDIEELEHAEIAETLGCTVNAAKIRVHRARQALKTLLETSCPGLHR